MTQFAEARKRALAAREERRKNVGSKEIVIENPATKKLLEIDKVIQAKNYAAAETQLKQLLQAYPGDAPRIYYALGRAASLSAEGISEPEARKNRLLQAKGFYENVIRSATPDTDKALLSLSYVAMARIYEFFGETAYAIKIYEAAIKIGDAASQSYKEATAARERLMKEQ
ncbi:MAG: hypothetical protein H0W58_11950 [Acidobacteria bacterium]|nr:hypothetical protein [Acidobacteriota bacterium]